MTTNKLLGGVALAALLAGAASAQDNFTVTTAGNGEFTDGMDFAAEYDGIIGAVAEFTHDAGNADYDSLGGTAIVDITFTFSGGLVLNEFGDDADFAEGANANCSFTVNGGGGIGSPSVTYRNDGADFRVCNNNTTFEFDLIRTAANASQDSGVTVTVACVSDCGTFQNESDTFTLIDDTTAYPPLSRSVTAGGTVTLDGDGIGPVGPHALGNVSYGFLNAGGLIQTDGNGGTVAGGGIAAVTNADVVASAELEINFPGGDAGIASVSVDTGAPLACTEDAGAAVNTWSCVLNAAQLVGLEANGDVTFTSDNAVAIATQTPTASLTVTSKTGYAAPTGLSGALNPIQWDDGVTDSAPYAFTWARFGTGGTESNFRLQFPGANAATDAAAVSELRVTVGAEGNGVPAGTYILTPGTADTGFVVQGGSITFNSRALGAVAGQTGNADISVRYRMTDAAAAAAGGPATAQRMLVNRSPDSFVATGGLTGN